MTLNSFIFTFYTILALCDLHVDLVPYYPLDLRTIGLAPMAYEKMLAHAAQFWSTANRENYLRIFFLQQSVKCTN